MCQCRSFFSFSHYYLPRFKELESGCFKRQVLRQGRIQNNLLHELGLIRIFTQPVVGELQKIGLKILKQTGQAKEYPDEAEKRIIKKQTSNSIVGNYQCTETYTYAQTCMQ